jgi:hypothetical protein
MRQTPTARCPSVDENGRRRHGRAARADCEIADFAIGLDIDAGAPVFVNLRAFYVHVDFDVANVNVPDPFTSFVSNRHCTTSQDYGFSAQWSKGFRAPTLANR